MTGLEIYQITQLLVSLMLQPWKRHGLENLREACDNQGLSYFVERSLGPRGLCFVSPTADGSLPLKADTPFVKMRIRSHLSNEIGKGPETTIITLLEKILGTNHDRTQARLLVIDWR